MAAFTASGHPHAVDWNPSNGTPPSTDSEQDSSLYEIVVDPQEAESSVSDLLLQLVGTDEGITGLHVESLQKGGVPFQVVTAALSSGWQGLQEQHSKLADIKAQVSVHVVPVKCVLSSGSCQEVPVTSVLSSVCCQEGRWPAGHDCNCFASSSTPSSHRACRTHTVMQIGLAMEEEGPPHLSVHSCVCPCLCLPASVCRSGSQ